jgi:hypothetical protein
VYKRDGQTLESPNYAVEIQHAGIRKRWSLWPGNTEAAAARARDLFLYVYSNGWPAALARYRPESIAQADPTVGDYIAAAAKTADLSPGTGQTYVQALRKIVSDIAGLSGDNRKYGGGRVHREWVARVDGSMQLGELTAAAIQKWKKPFLSKAAQDPISQRSARVPGCAAAKLICSNGPASYGKRI